MLIDQGITALVVEDNPIIVKLIKRILADYGCNVEVASNESAAYQYLYKGVDIVLIDMNLDKQTSGLEIAQSIQENFCHPFIFLTANKDLDILQKAVDIGPASYLSKPFNPIDLMAAIGIAIRNSKSIDQKVRLKCGMQVIQFDKSDLLYVLTDGNYLRLTTTKQQFFIRCTMSRFIEILNAPSFFRIHRTALVNSQKVERYSGSEVFVNGRKFIISRTKKDQFKRAMQLLPGLVSI